MEIDPETVRPMVERPLSLSEIEGLLRVLDDSGKARLPSRVCLGRCDIFRTAPPTRGWNGVVPAQSKN